MKHSDKLNAIQFIRPSAEFALRGDFLEWLDKNQIEPTEEEIETGWVAYQAKIESDKAEAQAKRTAALAKLEALGLDEDDLKALGL